ncbi:MAG: hypothetical protein JO254_00510 [Pseudolabrys sp.]|nr:hypothetical protein [Pseudolabrys sp.]
MSIAKGFFFGVGTVAIAATFGFTVGYVLTAPDDANKITSTAYDRHVQEARSAADSAREQPAAQAQQEPQVKSPEPVSTVFTQALIKPAEATPSPAVQASAPPAETTGVAVKDAPAAQTERTPERTAKPTAQPERKIAKAKHPARDAKAPLDLAQVRRAIEQDIRRRQGQSDTVMSSAQDEPLQTIEYRN